MFTTAHTCIAMRMQVAYRDELKKASGNDSDTEDTVVELNAVEQEQAKTKDEIEADIQDQIRDLRLKVSIYHHTSILLYYICVRVYGIVNPVAIA
jgi:hypothetical protein